MSSYRNCNGTQSSTQVDHAKPVPSWGICTYTGCSAHHAPRSKLCAEHKVKRTAEATERFAKSAAVSTAERERWQHVRRLLANTKERRQLTLLRIELSRLEAVEYRAISKLRRVREKLKSLMAEVEIAKVALESKKCEISSGAGGRIQ